MPESASAVPDLRDAVPAHGAPLPAALAPGRLFATAPEAAEVLRADPRTIRRALEAGDISGTRIGDGRYGHWRIPVAWLRQQAGLGTADGAGSASVA